MEWTEELGTAVTVRFNVIWFFYKYKCGTGTCQLNGKNKPFSDAWWEKGLSKLYFCFTIIITDIFLFPETSCSPEKWGFSHFRRGSIFYIKIIFILYWEIIFLPIPSTYNGLSLETKQAKTIGEFKWRLKNEKKNYSWAAILKTKTKHQTQEIISMKSQWKCHKIFTTWEWYPFMVQHGTS